MDIDNKYGTLEMQKQLLILMQKFDSFCSKNGLHYSLGGGSMLGAVREHGFIPWDDDLDINVDRKTYNRLMDLISHSSEFVVSRELWVYRVRLADGVVFPDGSMPTLDVFVVDNVPDSALLRKVKVLLIKMLQGMLKEEKSNGTVSIGYKVLLIVTKVMGLFFTKNFKLRMYESISQWGNSKKTIHVTVYNTLFKYLTNLYEGDLMEDFVRMPFESIDVSVSAGYHNHLTTLYGDYMTPPNQKERVPQHMKTE